MFNCAHLKNMYSFYLAVSPSLKNGGWLKNAPTKHSFLLWRHEKEKYKKKRIKFKKSKSELFEKL